jgi:hypothetical protein
MLAATNNNAASNNVSLDAFVNAANQAKKDNAVLKVSGNEVQRIGILGKLFTSAKAHRESMGQFLSALRKEYGSRIADIATCNLATPIAQGKPLQAYVVKAINTFAQQEYTIKDATKYAKENKLADHVDYTGLKPEFAKEWNKSISEHLKQFPEIRKNLKFIGSLQAHCKRSTAVCRDRQLNDMTSRHPGADANWLRHLVIKKVPDLSVPKEVYAISIGGLDAPGISVNAKFENAKFGAGPEAFKKALLENVKTGFHPIGCDTIRSQADHELGHQLDNLLGLSNHYEINKLFNNHKKSEFGDDKFVSTYAKENIQEFIAECWAECRNNEKPRPTAKAVGDIIKACYNAKYPSAKTQGT